MRMSSVLVLLILGLVSSAGAQTTQPAAESDGSYLQICLTTAADMSPIYPTSTLPADVDGVAAAFRLADDEMYEILGSRWIAVDVTPHAPPNTEIAQFQFRLEGRRFSDFRYSQNGPMPPGKYRLEVTADGKAWKSADFVIQPPDAMSDIRLREMRDLIPVREGKSWTYDFVQEGINVNIPGIEPDAEGKLHATTVVTVGATDGVGVPVETRRNGEVILDEWWRVTEGGIYTVRSRQPVDLYIFFQPPLLWIPFPPKNSMAWKYVPQNKAYEQAFKMWGPVPLQGPDGEAMGYIVVSDQKVDTLNRITCERHFIPGVGMTREVLISAFNDEVLRKQVTTLKSAEAAPTTAP